MEFDDDLSNQQLVHEHQPRPVLEQQIYLVRRFLGSTKTVPMNGSRDSQNVAICAAQNFFSYAAKQELRNTGTPMRADDDEIRRNLPRDRANCVSHRGRVVFDNSPHGEQFQDGQKSL